MEGLYRIAEKNIKVISLYDEIHSYCRDYALAEEAAQDAPDFVIAMTEEDLAFEQERTLRERAIERKQERPSYLDDPEMLERRKRFFETASPELLEKMEQHKMASLEIAAVYRKIAEQMPSYDTFLFHGSAIAVDGQAYLFTAKSGTGKSTHARLLRELLGGRCVMVNDDKPLIRVGGNAADGNGSAESSDAGSSDAGSGDANSGAMVFGTPWNGKHRLGSNICRPLKAICILDRAPENSIRRVSAGEAYPLLLQQAYRPLNGEAMQKTLTLIDRLASSVQFWHLYCNMDPSAAETSYEGMISQR